MDYSHWTWRHHRTPRGRRNFLSADCDAKHVTSGNLWHVVLRCAAGCARRPPFLLFAGEFRFFIALFLAMFLLRCCIFVRSSESARSAAVCESGGTRCSDGGHPLARNAAAVIGRQRVVSKLFSFCSSFPCLASFCDVSPVQVSLRRCVAQNTQGPDVARLLLQMFLSRFEA